MNFVKYLVKIPIFYILATMGLLLLGSVWHDSAAMDELAHIPAGFGYITQLDGRLNPEHPPLLKMLSAISGEIFVHPYFPTDTKAWRDDINGQWNQGRAFLYESGNDADRIIFWSRLPFLLLTIFFGILLWRWTRERFGSFVALLTLIFFAFSPTIIAHARYVTTDLGAAFGFFIGFIAFIKFLETPSWKNVLYTGIVFAVAELLKFSLVLLVPLYGMMILAWVLSRPKLHLHERIADFFKLSVKTAVISIIGIAIIWIAYIPLTWHYPPERQYADAKFILGSYPLRSLAEFDLTLIKNPVTRPLGQYMLGFLMVSQRAGGGNTGYFRDIVSASGSRMYFPIMYLYKEPLPFHILTLLALWIGLRNIQKNKDNKNIFHRFQEWVYAHFAEFSAFIFIALYWTSSIVSPLNIGIRHVLPTFPFIYMLVAKKLVQWIEVHVTSNPQNMIFVFLELSHRFLTAVPKYAVLSFFFLWFILGTIMTYPHFLSFYNELAGGTKNGYKIAVDSNYDWGQDLLRLHDYVDMNGIEKIAIDYFGGGNPQYYFGNKYESWWSSRGPAHGWFAISATFRQGAFGTPAPGFIRREEDSYTWLKQYEPVARAGQSIFIYKLP